VFGLASCGTMNAFAKKDANASTLAKRSEEVPKRIEDIRKHDTEVQRLIRNGDGALGNNDIDAAEQAFTELQSLEPGNLRAIEGLHKVEARRHHVVLLEEARNLLGKSEDDDHHAVAKLREILIENPDNSEARALYKGLLAKKEAEHLESLRKKLSYKNPVSLEFRDVGLKVIIEALAKSTGINFILDKDVRSDQKATLFVKNVSLDDAVDMLIQSNQLQKKVLNENSVLIYPNTANKLREYQDLIIRSFYLENADPKTVGNLLRSMLGVKDMQTDDRLPMIIIKDVPEMMVMVEKLIESQDVADPEVMLELEVLEITRTRDQDIGVTWPNQLSVIGAGLTLDKLKHLSSKDLGVSPNPAVTFKGSDSDTNLLANPRIRVMNKNKAKIHIGDRVPVITANITSTGTIAESVQYIDVGLMLEVEPSISLGSNVNIKLNLDVSSIGNSTKTNSGSVVYQIGTRSTSTQLRLMDGETQILAGLINDEDRKSVSKLPGLGDIPLLGRLFSDHGSQKTKTEIVLSITPHIIRGEKSIDASLAEYWSGSENQTGRPTSAPRMAGPMMPFSPPPQVDPPASLPTAAPNRGIGLPQGLNIPLPPGLAAPPSNGASNSR